MGVILSEIEKLASSKVFAWTHRVSFFDFGPWSQTSAPCHGLLILNFYGSREVSKVPSRKYIMIDDMDHFLLKIGSF